MTTKDEACTETACVFADAEHAADKGIKKACDLMISILKSQKVCAEDNEPVHGNDATRMKLFVAQAISDATDARGALADAHEAANKFCKDGGIIVTGGGGK